MDTLVTELLKAAGGNVAYLGAFAVIAFLVKALRLKDAEANQRQAELVDQLKEHSEQMAAIAVSTREALVSFRSTLENNTRALESLQTYFQRNGRAS